MPSDVNIDTKELEKFFDLLGKAAKGDFKRAMNEFLEGLGDEFLRIVQDEIIRRQVVDTRLLLASFHRGSNDNIWTANEGGLTLEVGTNLDYATYVNDGHWTCKQGQQKRFVPGVWSGGSFQYVAGARTGMILKQQWIEGAHYWESAIKILEKMYPKLLEAKLQEWLDQYFKNLR